MYTPHNVAAHALGIHFLRVVIGISPSRLSSRGGSGGDLLLRLAFWLGEYLHAVKPLCADHRP